jgi:ABC-2 type transport system permease protein
VNWYRIRTIAITDLRQLFKSRDYWGPLLVLAGLFFVVIPGIALLTITRVQDNYLLEQMQDVLETLPGGVQAAVRGNDPASRAAYFMAVFLLAPIAVVVPLTVSSAVGAHAIVGERERGTGEFLAHAPVSIREIYLGKLLASLVPGYIATLGGFALYSLIVNLLAGPSLGGWFFPTAGWWMLILWVLPPFLAVALSIIVWVSGRMRSTAASQQAASLVSLPVILLAYGVSGGVVVDPTRIALVIGAVAWVIAGTALTLGARAFDRERLLGFGG